jgi:hypothetical protein
MKIPQQNFHYDIGEYLRERAITLELDEIVTVEEVAVGVNLPISRAMLKHVRKIIERVRPRWVKYRFECVPGLVIGYRPVEPFQAPVSTPVKPAKFATHPWNASISNYLQEHREIEATTTSSLITSGIACPDAGCTRADAIVAGNVLRSLGWQKVRHYQGKRGSTVYVRPVAATESSVGIGAIGA